MVTATIKCHKHAFHTICALINQLYTQLSEEGTYYFAQSISWNSLDLSNVAWTPPSLHSSSVCS